MIRRKVALIISAAAFVGMLAAVMIFHAPPGNEDYSICKMFAHLGTGLFLLISYIFLTVELNGTRYIRSVPFARSLKIASVPLFCTIMGVGATVLVDLVYAVYIILTKQPITNISDMILISAMILFCYIVLGCVCMNFSYGYILAIYVWFPVAIIGFIMPESVWTEGFGMPVWQSLLVYAAVAVNSMAAAFAISRWFYEKLEFKPLPEQKIT